MRSPCSNKWIHPGLPDTCVFFLGAYKYNPITTLFGQQLTEPRRDNRLGDHLLTALAQGPGKRNWCEIPTRALPGAPDHKRTCCSDF